MSNELSAATLAVSQWLEAVFDTGDLAAAWPMTDTSLRLSVAQSWIMMESDRSDVAAQDRDELARTLAEPLQSSSPFWSEFAGWRVLRWREVLPDFVTDVATRGFVGGEHVLAPDIEQVFVTHTDTKVLAGQPLVAQRFLARQFDGKWFLAGIGGVLPIPGWPPSETDRFPSQ